MLRLLYGTYCWLVFLPLASMALLAVLLAPSLRLRRGATRLAARSFFALSGIRLVVRGLAHLPAGPCVVVANHSSYIDGVVMQAALPPHFAFVIKREMVSVPLASLLLRRLGSEFVERFNRHRSAADARRIARTAGTGQALAFFPEGTFNARPGLGKFHGGAFVIAARAGLPVVPVAIRGARSVLPPTAALPRPGRIEVQVLAPLRVPANAATAAVELKKAARDQILARIDEPDLDAA
jgi:1-acyl-sn-glycerol-3-phosphate acyltransferase